MDFRNQDPAGGVTRLLTGHHAEEIERSYEQLELLVNPTEEKANVNVMWDLNGSVDNLTTCYECLGNFRYA